MRCKWMKNLTLLVLCFVLSSYPVSSYAATGTMMDDVVSGSKKQVTNVSSVGIPETWTNPASEVLFSMENPCKKTSGKMSSYRQRYRKFIGMSAYRNGAFWGYGKHARLSRFRGIDCSAYAADFAKYVFGASSPVTYGSHRHTRVSQIHSGDVVKVTGSNHWFVVLERDGNKLYTAEGNWNHRVVISKTAYRIKNGRLYRKGKPFRHFEAAYHYGR